MKKSKNNMKQRYNLTSFKYRYNLSENQFNLIFSRMTDLEKTICLENGWDKLGFQNFLEYIGQEGRQYFSERQLNQFINQAIAQTMAIGSFIYLKMLKTSGYSSEKKLDLLLHQLGAEIDGNQMLQLVGTHKIADDLPPHHLFFHELARLVQVSYKGKILNNRKIHQLRMYIDRHNIHYIRHHFKLIGMTDEEALIRYARAKSENGGLNGKRLIAERGRFHNKYKGQTSLGKLNRKRLCPNFHGEFILDEKGHFVSQWNVLEENDKGEIISDLTHYQQKYKGRLTYFEEQIVNGESFNYANRNGKVHRNLDVFPCRTYDYGMRKKISKYWTTPLLNEYKWSKVDKAKHKSYRKGL